jgi:hypothetical protein
VAYTESANDDILYRTINAASADALSTETTIFAGVSATTTGGGWLTLTRSRGGNVFCYGCIDNGAEGGFWKLPNANVPNGAWGSALTNPEALEGSDQAILVPGFAADNQDIMCMLIDASANEIDRYIYDDSANSWGLTNIGSITDAAANTNFPHFAAAVDLTNSQIVLVYWDEVAAVNADLKCWTITEGAITAKTDVVLNSGGGQGLAAVGIDTAAGHWYAFYGGKSDGSESFPSVFLYYKVSTDSGTTWGPETKITNRPQLVKWIACPPRFTNDWVLAFYRDLAIDMLYVSVPLSAPSIGHQMAG